MSCDILCWVRKSGGAAGCEYWPRNPGAHAEGPNSKHNDKSKRLHKKGARRSVKNDRRNTEAELQNMSIGGT